MSRYWNWFDQRVFEPLSRPTSLPAATLAAILLSASATFLSVIGGTVLLIRFPALGRLNGFSLFWLVDFLCRPIGLDVTYWGSPGGWWQRYVNHAHIFDSPLAIGHFILDVFLLNFLVAIPLALLLAFAIFLAGRGPRTTTAAARSWSLSIAAPVVAFAAFLVPETLRQVNRIGPMRLTVGWVAVLSAFCLLTAIVTLHRRRWARFTLGLATLCSAVAAGAVAMLAATHLTAGMAQSGPAPPPPAAERPPNILLVSIDSLRADHLGAYGYHRDTSPNLDRLASQGAMFKTVVAPSSWTLPSHATLLSAMDPLEHGLTTDYRRFRADTRLLSDVLRAEGYATAGFVAAPYLWSDHRFNKGFDHYDDYTALRAPDDRGLQTRLVTSPLSWAATRNWLGEWNIEGQQRPFFIFLHLWDVHYNYLPPPPYDKMFDPDYTGLIAGYNVLESPYIVPDMPQRDLDHLIALYDGEIRFTDEHIGKLLRYLDDLGVGDETIIAVTADHGEEFFEHGWKTHRHSLYDELLLVPFIVRYPGKVPAGAVVEQQARLMDVAPTLLSLAGIDQPDDFGSSVYREEFAQQDLTPLISDPAAYLTPPPAFADLEGRMSAVRTPQYKWIEYSEAPDDLFDIAADPEEQHNIQSAKPNLANALESLYDAWQSNAPGAESAEALELSAEEIRALRSLGYLK